MTPEAPLILSKKSSQKAACLVVALLLPLLAGGAAWAEDARKQARELFQAAEQHYKLGRFQEALQEYSRAYELAPLPGFLFNIGQCHRLLHHYERAVFFYEGYLRERPDAANREAVLRLIEESQVKLGKQREEQKRLEEEQQRADEERRRAEAIRRDKERAEEQARLLALEKDRLAALVEARREEDKQGAPAFYQTWWFWTIVGGVVATAAGVTVYAVTAEDNLVLPSGSLGTLDLRGL